MNNIVQIMPGKKYANAPKNGLVVSFLNETEGKTFTEYTVFKRINQLDQFYIDKSQCTNFRFNGRINQTINLDFGQVQSSPIVLPKLEDFDVGQQDNWKIMLMAPLSISPTVKGDTSITVSDKGQKKILDFSEGLPALVVQAETINNKIRNGLLLYLGHNLLTNDVIHIKTTQTDSRYGNGMYRVVLVKGNKIYVQLLSLDKTQITQVSASTQSAVTDGNALSPAIVGGIELGITTTEFNSLTGDTIPTNWLAVYNPHIFVTKIVDKLPCQYYLKRLSLLREMEYGDVYNCGLAENAFNQPFHLYTVEERLSLMDMKNNLGVPLTDVYMVFVKKVSSPLKMTPVWAAFSNFVTSTFDGGGIQIVSLPFSNEVTMSTSAVSTDGIAGTDIKYDTAGSFLYHSLVEYNPLTIEEREINKVHHTFLSNTGDTADNHIRFAYDPFTHIPIRKLSNNINETDSILGLPEYIEADYRNSFYNEKFQNYRWRHILELGYFEAQNNGIDFPYLNDAFYTYTDVLLNIKNYKSAKVPAILTGGYLLSSYVDTLIPPPDIENTTGIDELDDSLLDQNKNDKPFEEYTGGIC